jgi:hypothetical protein
VCHIGGDPHTLTAGNCFVTSNYIANFSLWKRTYLLRTNGSLYWLRLTHCDVCTVMGRYVPGIFWNGIGNNFSFNKVHNGPHNCI